MHQQISSGTFHARSWATLRDAEVAVQLVGSPRAETQLGEYVRGVKGFADAFEAMEEQGTDPTAPCHPFMSRNMITLRKDVENYRNELVTLSLDDRDLQSASPPQELAFKAASQLLRSLILLVFSIPGLLQWAPVVLFTSIAISKFTRGRPLSYTGCRVSSRKIMYGLVSGLCVWFIATLLVLAFTSFAAAILIPPVMWASLLMAEDALTSLRIATAKLRLIRLDTDRSRKLLAAREELCSRLAALGVHPPQPDQHELRIRGKTAADDADAVVWKIGRPTRLWERLIIETKKHFSTGTGGFGSGKLGSSSFDGLEHLEDLDTSLPILTNRLSSH